MFNSKANALLFLLLCSVVISATSTGTISSYDTAQGLCNFKILVLGILPTIALIFFILTPFALGLAVIALIAGYFWYKKENPKGKIDLRNFKSLHIGLKVGLAILVAAILIPVAGVVCIVLAVITPIVVSMIAGNGVTSAC
jgi:glucan phosphoethanolaminetransferase (alkaline phosphatase superfamily)